MESTVHKVITNEGPRCIRHRRRDSLLVQRTDDRLDRQSRKIRGRTAYGVRLIDRPIARVVLNRCIGNIDRHALGGDTRSSARLSEENYRVGPEGVDRATNQIDRFSKDRRQDTVHF